MVLFKNNKPEYYISPIITLNNSDPIAVVGAKNYSRLLGELSRTQRFIKNMTDSPTKITLLVEKDIRWINYVFCVIYGDKKYDNGHNGVKSYIDSKKKEVYDIISSENGGEMFEGEDYVKGLNQAGISLDLLLNNISKEKENKLNRLKSLISL